MGWIHTGTNTYMSRNTFLTYTNDSDLTADEKQTLLNSQDGHAAVYEAFKERKRKLYSRSTNRSNQTQQQPQTAAPRDWTEAEVNELNPVFIDERLEKIKHLHPQQLDNKNNEY